VLAWYELVVDDTLDMVLIGIYMVNYRPWYI